MKNETDEKDLKIVILELLNTSQEKYIHSLTVDVDEEGLKLSAAERRVNQAYYDGKTEALEEVKDELEKLLKKTNLKED